MFNKYSLKAKLLGICAVLAGLIGVTGGIGTYALHSVSKDYSHVAEVNLPNTQYLGELRAQYYLARLHLRTLGMEGLSNDLAEKAVANLHKTIEAYEEADKKYTSIEFAPGEKELYEALNAEWKEYKTAALRIVDVWKRNDSNSKREMQAFYFVTAVANTVRFNTAFEKLLKFQDEQSHVWVGRAQSADRFGSVMMLVATVAGFAFALVIGLFFSNSLSRSLTRIAESLSSGATEVASAATEISSTSDSLSSSATEQASAIQETASSVDEMNAMVKKNSDNATQSVAVAKGSQDSATRGKQVVDEMIAAIDDISASNAEIMREIDASNREIADIVKVIAEIGNKTKVINDIVFQTKLLSFNASVEAARAGEHGKGFAVVAEEVGNLAQMSGNAAKEISAMLGESIEKVDQTVKATKTKVETLVAKGKAKVEVGTKIATRCGEVLEELVNNVGRVSEMVGEISTASGEQASGVQEISKAMQQLDQVTQQNTSASHQAAAAATQLATQAETMRASVAELLRAVNGTQEPRVERAHASVAHGRVLQFKKQAQVPPIGGDDALPSQTDARFKEA